MDCLHQMSGLHGVVGNIQGCLAGLGQDQSTHGATGKVAAGWE